MNGRFFLDTNLFVYSFDASAPSKAETARRLIRQGVDSGKGIVSNQVVEEFFNVALRRFARPMSLYDAEQYLSITFRPLLAVYSSLPLYGAALQLHGKDQLSWYDALIVAAALEGECQILYTEDLQDGRSFGDLRVKNPFSGI